MENYLKFNQAYSSEQQKVISKEFQRLQGQHYLEHAGATLYSDKQIQDVGLQLLNGIYANPHANNVSSKATEDAIDLIRFQILQTFGTNPEEYSVVFTSGATAALKLVGESFQYGARGHFLYLQDNHTSALGLRLYAPKSKCIKIDEAHQKLSKPELLDCKHVHSDEGNSLFVFPAESNFSGAKYPLDWIEMARNGALRDLASSNCYVMLDAAAFVSGNRLDLEKYKPDFVTISFYKIFGYPTGLGALLVKNGSEKVLNKIYFGGGAVSMALSLDNITVPRKILHERFEDGSLPFLSILALKQGFDTLKRLHLNFDLISKHAFNSAQYVYRHLACFHHSNGKPIAVLYHHKKFAEISEQGGIVNFNLLRDNGEHIGYSEVLHMANLYGIHLRTGCFCNPGACQFHLNLSSDDVKRHFEAGHECGDQNDLIQGQPTGSVRVSFGYMSTKADCDALLAMVRECFVTQPLIIKIPEDNQALARNKSISKASNKESRVEGVLEHIFLYPVKSCAACAVEKKWPLTSTGLKYDREWMVVNSLGVCMTQKLNKQMCLISPALDLKRRILTLSFPGRGRVEVLMDADDLKLRGSVLCRSKVCGDQVQGYDCGDVAAGWLDRVLDGQGFRLLRQDSADSLRSFKSEQPQLSLANKAQFLLLNSASVRWLQDRIEDGEFSEDLLSTVHRFRPNFVVDFDEAFAENGFEEFTFGTVHFKSGGNCTRCQMICIDQKTGKISKEPLRTLSKEFKGKICFGIYLNRNDVSKNDHLTIGCKVHAL